MIEVPILFAIIACILIVGGGITAFAFGVTGRSWKLKYKRELAKPQQYVWKPTLISDKKHGLKQCYLNTGQWVWNCECGVSGKSRTAFGEIASEENAMKQWLAHVQIHEKYILPTHELSHAACDKRFVGLWALFEKYRKACYCQNVNNELIVLNEEVKKLEEKSSEKGVQL